MLDALAITEAEAAGLSELAEMDLAMARHFSQRAQAAEDPDIANDLARSYQRAARSYRQSLALKARLQRDLAQAAAAAKAVPRPKPGGVAIATRIRELKTALLRVAWDEAERPEDEGGRNEDAFCLWIPDIEGCVSEECLKDSFCDEALDDHVARVGYALGFAPETLEAWRGLPDPPAEVVQRPFDLFDGLDPPRESSA
jgi:hypothetical protein